MTAAEILQARLDAVSAICMAGDWPAYRAAVRLPFSLGTAAAAFTIDTDDELRKGFEVFLSMLRLRGVTDYLRIVRSAEFDGAHRITGSYDSHLLRNAERVVPEFHSDVELECHDGIWLFTRITNTWDNARWPVVTPQVTGTRRTPKEDRK